MLLEPSSGSYMMTYLPRRDALGQSIGCSSSSDATMHTRPVCCTAWRTVSRANRSSFCCRSPETFTAPESAAPRMSLKPARRTWREMILAARHRSYSRFDSSPVASGWSRSCSMMKRSIVTTDVDVCTLAIGRKGDSARLVRPEDLTAPTPQPVEHLRCRMAVMIVRAHADHGLARPQLAEPRIRRGSRRAVMPHLEQLHTAHPPREVPFHRQPRVGLKQQARSAKGHPYNHAVLVDVERQRHPDAVRAQHLEHHAVHLDPIAGARRVPARPRPLDRREKLEVQRPAEWLAGLEHQLGAERLDHGRQPAQMIRVSVRRHHQGEAPGTVTSQERDHHPAPRVAPRDPRAAVDHHPAAVRRSESCRVALPYIQEKYSQATAIVERDDVTERRRYENRDQKCGTGPNQPAAARGIP